MFRTHAIGMGTNLILIWLFFVQMKTILHIIDTTGPGGAETIFIQLAKKAADEGHNSIALIRGSGWVQLQLEQLNIPFFVVDCKGSFNLRFIIRLIKIILANKVGMIQSHLLGSNVYSCIAGIVTRTRVISTFHGLVDIAPGENFRLLKLLVLNFGSYKIVTVTDRLNKLIASLPFISKSKVVTIYNGIDVDYFKRINASNFRNKVGVSDKEILIGSLGNIRTPKNYPLAIRTIKTLHEQGINVHYAIAGHGSEKQMEPLTQLIEELGLNEYIHLLGFSENTTEFLSALDIFLLTSTSEGHPLALTQAMANGVPIVSTKSGVEEIVADGNEALLTESMTPSAVAEKITFLLRDDSLRNSIIRNASLKANSDYSLNAMFSSYLKLYSVKR